MTTFNCPCCKKSNTMLSLAGVELKLLPRCRWCNKGPFERKKRLYRYQLRVEEALAALDQEREQEETK